MLTIFNSTLRLYREALHATWRSLIRGWFVILAVIVFTLLMMLAHQIARPLGMLGGFLLGAVNALLIGATLSLIEQSVKGMRAIAMQDVLESMGHYFWDVISVGFVLWIPTMLLDTSLRANPDSQFLVMACLLLVFILLNPAPEVIYLTRHDSPLDVLKRSYDFVLDNWIEWFLPMALVLAPLGLSLFFKLSSQLGRGAGLDFIQLVLVPFTILSAWLTDLGISPSLTGMMALLLTPPLMVGMLLFRGHLFSALSSTSRSTTRLSIAISRLSSLGCHSILTRTASCFCII
ncbi:MAG: hypothetical protein QM771_05150 [Nitrospira sp.]